MKNIKVDINDNNQTVIKFLNKYFETAPNSLIYKWVRTKKIKVNKKRIEPSTLIFAGDEINIYIYDEEIEKWQKNKKTVKSRINLDILYENKDVIIIDKPQDILVHAASKDDYGKNVVDFIVDLLIERKEYIPRLEPTFRPSVVNRIDRNTMGLVIGGKNREAVLKLNRAIESYYIRKYYIAIVSGEIKQEKIIDNILYKDENNVVHVSEIGKKSKTIIRPIKFDKYYSLIEIELVTGRTHQIRATLADIGHPIIGDKKYGDFKKSKLYKNQQLVAYKIVFDKNIELESIRGKIIESKYKNYIFSLYEKLVGRNNAK